MMRVQRIRCRNNFFEPAFDRLWRFADGKRDPVRNPKYMRIHRHGRPTKGHIQHDIGGFPANAWQLHQCIPIFRHLSLMIRDQRL